MLLFKLFMGALTGISLLVGGIGIMNVLLASVIERTREIGIRKAAGAQHRHILLQFLSESVTISGVGSMIGVALGVVAAFARDGDHAQGRAWGADLRRVLARDVSRRGDCVGVRGTDVRAVSGAARGPAVTDRRDSPRVTQSVISY